MEYRKFKDVEIAEVGLGTWQLGSADCGNVNEADAMGILQAYVKEGGNFIDTADVYGMGVSETIIGKFLKTVDKPIYVATKLGRKGDASGWPPAYTYDYLKRHTEDSLKHLGLSQLFLQQLHCVPTEVMRKGEIFEHLRKLQQDGLIKHFGASVETSEEALICLEQNGLASLQMIFNIFRQHVADEVFAKAKEKGVAIIVRVPLASGLLSGKFSEDTSFAPGDHRNFNANGESFNAGETFSGIEFKEGVRLANKIKGILPDSRMPQWAIRWILDHPEVTTVIPGASKVWQVYSNIESSDLKPLPHEIHESLRKLYDEHIHDKIRGHY
jgi:aryl-alcohol dehydrogenase-like predicted oxidoreductase